MVKGMEQKQNGVQGATSWAPKVKGAMCMPPRKVKKNCVKELNFERFFPLITPKKCFEFSAVIVKYLVVFKQSACALRVKRYIRKTVFG